jgi:hypothetical protein
VLSELNNIDKHRVIHVAARVMTGAAMPVAHPMPVVPRSSDYQGPFNVQAIARPDGKPFVIEIKSDIAAEGRTLVARWPMIPIDPSKPMYMGFRPVMDIAFEPSTPLVADRRVVEVMWEINEHIVANVLPPLTRFIK